MEKAKELYKKSHHDYEPGEQVSRNYNWAFDQNQHVFGKNNSKIDSIKDCFSQNEIYQERVIPIRVKNYNEITKDTVGQSKTNQIIP